METLRQLLGFGEGFWGYFGVFLFLVFLVLFAVGAVILVLGWFPRRDSDGEGS